MRPGHPSQVRAWLDQRLGPGADPASVERLRHALGGPDGQRLLEVRPHGTSICFDPAAPSDAPRRILEFDDRGVLLSALRWARDGRLACAWVRIADGSWLGVEPGATDEAAWGRADRLWHADAPADSPRRATAASPLTLFEALDYARIDRIPTLAEPARLPPGGGSVVLNLIASLAADQARPRLEYRGPYPTEQLFLTLLESFRYESSGGDPLAGFFAGDLGWIPAPFERRFVPDGPSVHLRGRVEKVVWRGVSYYRPDWQDVARHAPRRVRDAEDGVRCSLWALGAVVEDHLLLTTEGELARILDADRPPGAAAPMPPPIRAGVISMVAATSAPALAAAVRAVGEGLELEWGPVEGDLVRAEAARARVSTRLREAMLDHLARADGTAGRLAVGLAALGEIAQLLGDTLRSRAQAWLLAAPPDTQAAALADVEPEGGAERARASARAIADAAAALVAEHLTSNASRDRR